MSRGTIRKPNQVIAVKRTLEEVLEEDDRPDLSGLDLRHVDLRGRDLRGCRFNLRGEPVTAARRAA